MIAYDSPEHFNLAVWRQERDGEPYPFTSGVSTMSQNKVPWGPEPLETGSAAATPAEYEEKRRKYEAQRDARAFKPFPPEEQARLTAFYLKPQIGD